MNDSNNVAETNKAKISHFGKSIGFQIAIFLCVIYATVMDNEVAEYVLYAYMCLVVVGLLSYIVITFTPIHILLVKEFTESQINVFTSPSYRVARGIATCFSVVEIALFFNYGFFYIMATWAVTEVFQYISMRKMRKVIALSGNEDNNMEFIKNFVENKMPELTEIFEKIEAVGEKIAQIDKELKAIDHSIEVAKEQGISFSDHSMVTLAQRASELKDDRNTYISEVSEQHDRLSQIGEENTKDE